MYAWLFYRQAAGNQRAKNARASSRRSYASRTGQQDIFSKEVKISLLLLFLSGLALQAQKFQNNFSLGKILCHILARPWRNFRTKITTLFL